jgi:hypothetical protein
MQLPALPELAYDTLKMVREERLRLEWHSQQLVEVEESLRRNQRATIWAIAGGALLVCAALLWTGAPPEAARVAGAPPLAWLALALGAVALIRGRFVR